MTDEEIAAFKDGVDQGIRHVYVKARTPQANGKVERSHRTDQQEFYQLLSYTDHLDLGRRWRSGRLSTTTTASSSLHGPDALRRAPERLQ
jgi:hypothetical protein